MLENEETVKIFTLERKHEYLLPLLKETFKNEHIALYVRSKYDTAYNGVYIGEKGVADIYVFQKDKEQAERLLRDILSSSEET